MEVSIRVFLMEGVTMSKIWIVLVAIVVLVVAGCAVQPMVPASPADNTVILRVSGDLSGLTSPPEAANNIYQVAVTDDEFSPATVELNVGDTIEWLNEGNETHSISFYDGAMDEKLPRQATLTHTFTEAGEFYYYDQLHPRLRGSVIVS
ncbi:TPA: hypothetical protein HA242_06755 [Candidatus Woesearchaeota archaeon]|nr:cupredoxin domain-containing protein [Candidatus Woesearchaeota archaeon]HIH13394.1 hypothetical protein [Candidatus Woesearchaeota archaeon]